ncbi:MAG TPA: RNA-binding protein [Gammaproteobacteria bacterium]
MGRKLYVGNLPFSTTEDDLAAKFGQCGTVESAKLITDRDTGRSKGFGFVEMSSEAEARAAIEQLNGTDYQGRPMTVNEARPQQKKPMGQGGRGSGGRGGYGGGYGGNRW